MGIFDQLRAKGVETLQSVHRDAVLPRKLMKDAQKLLGDIHKQEKEEKLEKKSIQEHNLAHLIKSVEALTVDSKDMRDHLHDVFFVLITLCHREIQKKSDEINTLGKTPAKDQLTKLENELNSWRVLCYRMGEAISQVGKTG